MEAMQKALSFPEGEAAIADLQNFAGVERTTTVVADEVEAI